MITKLAADQPETPSVLRARRGRHRSRRPARLWSQRGRLHRDCADQHALGTIMPVLRDAGELRTPFGTAVIGIGAAGEFGPLIAISLFLSGRNPGVSAAVLLAFTVLAATAIVISARGHHHNLHAMINTTPADQRTVRRPLRHPDRRRDGGAEPRPGARHAARRLRRRDDFRSSWPSPTSARNPVICPSPWRVRSLEPECSRSCCSRWSPWPSDAPADPATRRSLSTRTSLTKPDPLGGDCRPGGKPNGVSVGHVRCPSHPRGLQFPVGTPPHAPAAVARPSRTLGGITAL